MDQRPDPPANFLVERCRPEVDLVLGRALSAGADLPADRIAMAIPLQPRSPGSADDNP